MKIKLKPILLAIAALFFLPPKGASTDFNQQLCDSTLRIDYILSGNSNNQRIALHKLSATPGWAGRRVNLDSLPMRGNGQLELLDAATGKRLYAMSFSTLFQEWLTTDEARDCERSFENTFQIPMPVDKAVARLVLLDERGDTIANHSATIDHSDILIQRSKPDRLPDFRYISQGGDPARAIDVAIVAEGYQADEMDKFYTRAAEAVESLRNHEPFGSRFNDFNFIAVATPSADSGVSIPRLNEWRNTAVGSRFSTFYSNRYLTTPNVFHLHDLLQGIPYEHIIILANTDEYGGG
ncbi:MAG: IgA Peptidase M64, partial [Muribaculaceae bacterium]|nr:IgA Peptidase M64 [Muribaculaceae bacterium]